MGLYDEVTVDRDSKVKIIPPKDFYQSNTLGCTLAILNIDKDGYIRKPGDPDLVINELCFELYGEDETEYHRRYKLAVVNNRIISVDEENDHGEMTSIYMDPRVAAATKRMLDNMLSVHAFYKRHAPFPPSSPREK